MRQWLYVFLIVSSIWGCSSTEKNANTPDGLYKIAQEYDKDERYDLAIQRYQDLKNKFPYSSYAVLAELAIGDSYYKQESFAEAQVAYQNFKDLHPKHAKIDYVTYQLAMSFYKQLPSTIDRDLTLANDAIKNYQELLNRFPTSEYRTDSRAKMQECFDKLAAKEDYVAEFYFKRGVWQSALPRFEGLIERFPESEFVAKAHSHAAIAAFNMGDSSKANDHLRILEENFPSSDYVHEARKVIRR